MICFSDSTEHGPAITTNSPPPISVPFTFILVFPARNSLLTNLYGAEIRTTLSTCGMASIDSMHAVTSPTPTTPMTTRSSPSMECTLYPKCSTCLRTSSISSRFACNFMEMIIFPALSICFSSLKTKNPLGWRVGRIFFSGFALQKRPPPPGWIPSKSIPAVGVGEPGVHDLPILFLPVPRHNSFFESLESRRAAEFQFVLRRIEPRCDSA